MNRNSSTPNPSIIEENIENIFPVISFYSCYKSRREKNDAEIMLEATIQMCVYEENKKYRFPFIYTYTSMNGCEENFMKWSHENS